MLEAAAVISSMGRLTLLPNIAAEPQAKVVVAREEGGGGCPKKGLSSERSDLQVDVSQTIAATDDSNIQPCTAPGSWCDQWSHTLPEVDVKASIPRAPSLERLLSNFDAQLSSPPAVAQLRSHKQQ